MRKYWWQITDEEIARLNPPPLIHTTDDDGNWYVQELEDDKWLSIGHIPRPRNRFEWLLYDLCHGFAMRYPWHKVLGFALSSLAIDREVVINVDMSKLQWQERDGRMVAETEYGEFEAHWPSLANEPDGNDPFPHLPISGTPSPTTKTPGQGG